METILEEVKEYTSKFGSCRTMGLLIQFLGIIFNSYMLFLEIRESKGLKCENYRHHLTAKQMLFGG